MNVFLPLWIGLLLPLAAAVPSAKLTEGDTLQVTVRGVPSSEQQGINGEYNVDDRGGVRLPHLEKPLNAKGLSASQFARAAEKAYQTAGIYRAPAIEVVSKADIKAAGAMISVGGHVGRDGRFPFQKGMTVMQAIDGAGGCNEFASRNVFLYRKGKRVCLDFRDLAHKNIELQQGDSLQVDQRPAILDRWKGKPEEVAPYL